MDVYLAKYDSNGVYQWAVSHGGPAITYTGTNVGETAYAVCVDDSGNTYMSGTFYQYAYFGPYQVNATNYPNGGTNGYIAKHDAAGNLKWVLQGNSNYDLFNDLETTKAGGVYFSGSYGGTGVLGGDTLIHPFPGPYQRGTFAGKVSASGQFDWISAAHDTLSMGISDLALGPSEELHVGGYFQRKALFDTLQLFYPNGYPGAPFIAKLQDDCNLQPPLFPQIIVNGPTTFCGGDTVQLTASGGGSIQWSTGDTAASIWVTQSGSIGLTLTDTIGCTFQSQPEQITVWPNPIPVINPSRNVTLCPNDTLTLTTSSTGSIVWNTGDTTTSIRVADSGAFSITVTTSQGCLNASDTTWVHQAAPFTPPIAQNGSQLTTGTYFYYQWLLDGNLIPGATGPTFSPTVSGCYQVTVNDSFGCPATSDTLCLTLNALESTLPPGISLFPNPTSGSCQVILNGKNGMIWELWDPIGRKLRSGTFSTGKNSLDLQAESTGIYLLSIHDHSRIYPVRIQVTR